MNPEPTSPSRRMRGAASVFIDHLRQRGRVAFPLSELERRSELSHLAARRQLARLGERVKRAAPRQAFFLIVEPEHRALGAPPPTWWLDAYFHWIGRPYYLALQSAAAEHGSAAQAVQVTQVMTDRPRRELRLGRVRVQFFVKRAIAATPTQVLAQAHAPLLVSTPAATVVDLVRYASRVGGVARAAETMVPLLPRVERADLERALAGQIEVPTLQRLGYLLERLGHRRLAKVIRDRLQRPLGSAALDSSVPIGKHAADLDVRWSLLVNATVESHP